MQTALYGPNGFYRRERPLSHFHTSAALAPFADAVRTLAGRVDDLLDRPDPFDVVDLGAGGGELLGSLPDVPPRWRLTAVEVEPDAGGAPLRWMSTVPSVHGLLFANEWLDSVPLDVVSSGRTLEVSDDGTERLGPPADKAALGWCRRWWPDGRAEVGLTRDRAWVDASGRVERGLAVAVDYGHTADTRRATLTGYRNGRQVLPTPDGSCDLTAHVALDSAATATGSIVMSQREALRILGLSGSVPGHLPGTVLPEELQRASEEAELLAPSGFGSFSWLLRPVGIADPLRLGR